MYNFPVSNYIETETPKQPHLGLKVGAIWVQKWSEIKMFLEDTRLVSSNRYANAMHGIGLAQSF